MLALKEPVDLEDTSKSSYDVILGTSLLLHPIVHFGDASASLILRNICTANHLLILSHTIVDIHILCSDE